MSKQGPELAGFPFGETRPLGGIDKDIIVELALIRGLLVLRAQMEEHQYPHAHEHNHQKNDNNAPIGALPTDLTYKVLPGTGGREGK
jgi:hypothetical protein